MKDIVTQILQARRISPNRNLNQPKADTYLLIRLLKRRLLNHEEIRQEILHPR